MEQKEKSRIEELKDREYQKRIKNEQKQLKIFMGEEVSHSSSDIDSVDQITKDDEDNREYNVFYNKHEIKKTVKE